MKKFLALTLALLMALSLVACGSQPAADDNQDADSTPVDTSNYVKTDYNPTKPMTKGINGEDPASLADFSFTDEELQQLKDGNFKVSIAYHQLGDQCNVVKCEAAKATFEELGIEVLTVTEAQMNDNTQYDQLETIAAMNPDALLVMPYNPDVCSPVLKKMADAGTKIVFMESIATDFTPGENCVALVSSDGYANGYYAATMLAEKIGYKGVVGALTYDGFHLVCNQRDQGFRDGIANFPEITLAESPFTKEANTGSNADSLLAQYPDLAGVYVSWEAPAEYVMASAKAAGREDLQIVTIDLGDTSARSIATGGMITCSATSRSWDQGTCEAYCAAYALLGKELPSTFVCPVALPVDAHNLLEGYCASYGLDQAPEWLTELVAE